MEAGISWVAETLDFLGYKVKKPPRRTCSLGGKGFPAPEVEAPERNSGYWVVGLLRLDFLLWIGTTEELSWLSLGIIHLNQEDAAAHQSALLSANRKALEEV